MPPQGASEELHAAISGATTDETLVAAVAGKKIRVTSFYLVAAAAVSVAFESSTTSALTGIMTLATPFVLEAGYNPHGHFETVAGELLNMTLGGAIQVSGWLTYQLID